MRAWATYELLKWPPEYLEPVDLPLPIFLIIVFNILCYHVIKWQIIDDEGEEENDDDHDDDDHDDHDDDEDDDDDYMMIMIMMTMTMMIMMMIMTTTTMMMMMMIARSLMAFFLIFPTVIEGDTYFFAHKKFSKTFKILFSIRLSE